MPITQDRMLALIHAAQDFYDQWSALDAFVEQAFETAQRGGDPMTALADLYMRRPHCQPNQQSTLTLGDERSHYKATRHKNRRNRERAEIARERAGLPRHDHKPRQPNIFHDADGEPFWKRPEGKYERDPYAGAPQEYKDWLLSEGEANGESNVVKLSTDPAKAQSAIIGLQPLRELDNEADLFGESDGKSSDGELKGE